MQTLAESHAAAGPAGTTTPFGGIWVPLVTPFREGAVDHEGLKRLVRHLDHQGLAGLVVCGSTGEAAALDEAEQRAVLDTVMSVRGDLKVIVGVSGVTPGGVARRLRELAGLPLAGVLVPSPYYVKPSQAGLIDFFNTVADASPVPVVLYDIPGRTGVRIDTDTMLTLARHPRIQAVKDCAGDPDHTQAVIDDGRLQLLCGDDARIFTSLCQGAVGAIAASAHLHPAAFARLHRQLQAGDLLAARPAWRALWPLTRALFAEPNPGPVKAALALRLGLSNELRAPMTAASPGLTARLASLLEVLDAGERRA
ncbi:4-hydroxy-tetrahydrodipicolinate synthase [Ideonella sp. DXS29W]|uniref:4-hydroxy-tetrahydrodipicolinate synthase n=1 Tax=Ideonella lacteola TaxID=2984193 RepID=A0ABU9BSP5_9BURK